MGSAEVLEMLRKNNVVPLPCSKTLKRKFQFMHNTKGFLESSFLYLKDLVPRMEHGDQIAVLMFDETGTNRIASRDQNIDAIIGPYAEAQAVIVQSLTGKWSMPVYIGFDEVMTVTRLFEIINRLEEIGVHIHATVCDMGGKNLGMKKVYSMQS